MPARRAQAYNPSMHNPRMEETMAFDLDDTLAAMLKVLPPDAGQEGLRRALLAERDELARLAQAALDGTLDDDALATQLRRARTALCAALHEHPQLGATQAQAAARAAIGVFGEHVRAARPKPFKASKTTGKRAASGSTARTAARSRTKHPLALAERKLNARPDSPDFRDLLYVPTLVEVPQERPLAAYLKAKVPILDQGQEGACTGFGLAAVAHYLLRTRKVRADKRDISPRMLYEMARRYDEWPGEDYDGSSCRGAMKGWHKHGVCAAGMWPHVPGSGVGVLTDQRAKDALDRPLGAYFRVNHKDLVAMHAALAETGILYASATVHAGWNDVGADGLIRYTGSESVLGGHAFAIVAFDARGFWIQNSWGPAWGKGGFCHVGYDDWLTHGSDVWVARLGVPIVLGAAGVGTARAFATSAQAKTLAFEDIRPHVVSIGNDGQLRTTGNIGTTAEQVRRILRDDFTRLTKGWKKKRIVLYAHGGLVGEESALQRVADYRSAMLDAQCYPLAFIWKTDLWTTLGNLLQDALRHRRADSGLLDRAKDFMLDRLDDALEPLARTLGGKLCWDEMKENAVLATQSATGGARLVATELQRLLQADPAIELHVVGHSAGSIFHGPLLHLLSAPVAEGGLGLPVASCALWAPACTMSLFDQTYLPALQAGRLQRLALYTLTDQAEQDDQVSRIYNKSLLYLVSHALEKRPRIPIVRPEGEALLGLARYVERHAGIAAQIAAGRLTWVQAPNTLPPSQTGASRATQHGAFDDDDATVRSSLAFVLGAGLAGAVDAPAKAIRGKAGKGKAGAATVAAATAAALPELQFYRGPSSLRSLRRDLEEAGSR